MGVGLRFYKEVQGSLTLISQHLGIAKMRGGGGNFCGVRCVLFGSTFYAVQCRTAAMRDESIGRGRQNETPLSAPQAADGVSSFAVCEAFFLFTADFFFLSRKKEKRLSRLNCQVTDCGDTAVAGTTERRAT